MAARSPASSRRRDAYDIDFKTGLMVHGTASATWSTASRPTGRDAREKYLKEIGR